MLVLKKKGVSSSYRLFDGDLEIGLLRSDRSWRSGSIELGGRQIVLAATGPGRIEFTATVDGDAVASGSRSESGGRAYDVDGSGVVLHMLLDGLRQNPFDVTGEAGDSVGVVALRGAMGRRIEIDLPARIPEAVQVFCGWLATRDYNNAAQVRAVMP